MEPSLVTGTFKTEPGRHLFFRRWIPDCPSKGTIVIAHGLGEHSGRYVHVGDFFARAGFTAFAFDLRGHGSSDGKPIFIRRYQDYLDDLESVITQLGRPEPFILFGHSLGGQLVLAYAQSGKRAPAGYIAASPWLGLSRPPPIWLEGAARLLNLVLPGWRFPTGIESGDNSRDQALLNGETEILDLELRHFQLTKTENLRWIEIEGQDIQTSREWLTALLQAKLGRKAVPLPVQLGWLIEFLS